MRFLTMLSGALLGAVPGLLLMAIGQIVTDGGDGMIPFGLGGVGLIVVGLIIGGYWDGEDPVGLAITVSSEQSSDWELFSWLGAG